MTSCPGIEIAPGEHSGCKAYTCDQCKGEGRINYWKAECPKCLGCGEILDCPECKPEKSPIVRSARFSTYKRAYETYSDGEF